jgi:hypothetical protein
VTSKEKENPGVDLELPNGLKQTGNVLRLKNFEAITKEVVPTFEG